MNTDYVIGVLGGMGTNATIHLFQQYADLFPAVKEWDRPRIIIDNRCTMPSRVRAILYKENFEELIDEMSDSIRCLIHAGSSRIILACNTSHLFLPQIYEKVPEAENLIINIIDCCVKKIVSDGIKEVYLLASEGTIESGIYQIALKQNGIKCIVPSIEEYSNIRLCIEAVKQNSSFDCVESIFKDLVNRFDSCILGCTELPILYEKYYDGLECERVYDPLYLGLMKIKEEFNNE